jgi:hypothetical protein
MYFSSYLSTGVTNFRKFEWEQKILVTSYITIDKFFDILSILRCQFDKKHTHYYYYYMSTSFLFCEVPFFRLLLMFRCVKNHDIFYDCRSKCRDLFLAYVPFFLLSWQKSWHLVDQMSWLSWIDNKFVHDKCHCRDWNFFDENDNHDIRFEFRYSKKLVQI